VASRALGALVLPLVAAGAALPRATPVQGGGNTVPTFSPLIGRTNPAYQPTTDFNGTSRAGDLTAGAYVFDPAGNPGH